MCRVEPVGSPRRAGWHDGNIDGTRIDQWLWAVRAAKTRSAASAACRGGHVTVNGVTVKPAAPVRVGDRVEVRVGPRVRVLEVVRLIEARVGATVAAECIVDHSPPPPPKDPAAPTSRPPGAGRPTKRERRTLDRFRGR